MTRRFLAVVVLLVAPLAGAADNDVPKDLVPLQGQWKLIDSEIEGRSLSTGEPSPLRFFVLRDELRVTADGIGWGSWGTITVDPVKSPPEINVKDKQGIRPGIYKIEKDRLTIVLCDTPKTDRPKTFSTKDNPDVQLYLLERIKK